MVDTIKIRLNDLVKHQHIYNACRNNTDVITYDYVAKNKSKYVHEYKENETPLYEYGVLIEHAEVVYQETKNKVERFKTHNRYNPSSHYSVRTFVNKSKDCIVWEFSIPKYFYGTNIIQAVKNPLETGFLLLRGVTDALQRQRTEFFPRLLTFIEGFFKKEYSGMLIDWNEAEILQIDMCYNQIFNSKREALMYLNMQQTMKRKGDREGSNKYRNYETSIFFGSKPYKCEIYHKGTEYEKNDKKKHEKINRKFEKAGHRKIFDVDYLQGLADKTLRYEVSIRNQKLSYLFNEKIFRKGSKSFQLLKEIYNRLRSKKDNNRLNSYEDVKDIVYDYRHTAINGVKDVPVIHFICNYFRHYSKGFDEVLLEHEIFNTLCKFQMQMDRLLNTTRHFYLGLTDEEASIAKTDRTSNISMFETFIYHKFDAEMFGACFDFFHDFIKEFIVEQKSDLNTYIERVDKYNDRVEKENKIAKMFGRKLQSKLDRNRMVMLLGFTESYSLDQTKKMLMPDISRDNPRFARLDDKEFFLETKKIKDSHDRLFRKYQTELKKLGISKNTINEGKQIEAPLDFFAYYNDLNMNIGRWNVTNTPYRLFSK